VKRRVLFVGRTRYRLPLEPSLARKWEALRERFDLRVLASAGGPSGGDATFRLVPKLPLADGPLFYALLPFRVARELRELRPDAVIAQSPYEGAACLLALRLARSRAKLIVEAHGDWETSTRLYGSPARRALAPLGDRIAVAAFRRADATRALSGYTAGLLRGLGVEPTAVFPTYSDLTVFSGPPPAPLPDRPQALFVGVLQDYKNVDGLAAAWRLAAPRVAPAVLHVVGRGPRAPVIEALVRDLPAQARWTESLRAPELAAELDASTLLLLPSNAEGLGRVVIEAFLRSRPVIGSRVGGIPDLIEDGVNGLLVPPGDVDALAQAIVSLLPDRDRAERMGEAARETAKAWDSTPERFAERMAELVDAAL
jgi:glycosyltransferase involved in cell wall biosynthesis